MSKNNRSRRRRRAGNKPAPANLTTESVESLTQNAAESATISGKLGDKGPLLIPNTGQLPTPNKKEEHSDPAITEAHEQTRPPVRERESQAVLIEKMQQTGKSDQASTGIAPILKTDSREEEKQEAEPESSSDGNDEQYSPPPSIGSHLRWKRRRDSWLPMVTVVVSLMALLMITAQVFIYDQQRRIMNTQVSLSEKNLRISERAYVGVASINADLAQGEIVVMLENLGRVPR